MTKRKAPITQDSVNTACNELIEAGKAATVNAVINKIGGSFSTVGVMVNRWKEEQAAQTMPVIEMPKMVTQAMHRAVADIWGTASALAGETVDRIQSEASDTVDKAKAELSEYVDEVKRLEENIEGLNVSLSTSEEHISQRDGRIVELITNNKALQGRINDKEKEIERIRADYEKLQAELVKIAKAQSKKEQGARR